MENDWCLLKQYIDSKSEQAFSKIVQRHIKVVYWTCRRETRNEQHAEDSTQQVFLLLAKKAKYLSPDVSISGWLFRASILVSKDVCKREARRMLGEEKIANQLSDCHPEMGNEWPSIDCVLNEGIASLSAADREAILLRYFDGMSAAEIAACTGSTEVNTRKRLSRAIEKMRSFLYKKEIMISSASLGALLAHHSSQTIPTSCYSSTISGVSGLASGHGATIDHPTFSSGLIQKGLYLIMESTKRKLLVSGIASLLILGGIGIPITKYCQARAFDQKVIAIIGPGGYVDQSTSFPASENTISEADKTEIDSCYSELTADFNNRQINRIYNVLAPNMSYGVGDSATPISPQQFLGRQEEFQNNHPQTKIYYSVLSMTRTPDDIVVKSQIKFVSLENKDDHVPGAILTDNNDVEDHWQKLDGHWLMIKSNGLTQSTSLQKVN